MEDKFNCDGCALCCKNVGFNKLLPSTNGVCDLLIDDKCSIYDDRPLYCRVDEYREEFHNNITKKEWYNLNEISCNQLKKVNRVNQ